MKGTLIVGIACMTIGVIAPIYIAAKKPQRLKSWWFITFLVADVAWMLFLGLQFIKETENF